MENLRRQLFEHYSPRLYDTVTRKVVPLFPGYLFVKIEAAWRSIRGTVGVAGLIMSEDGPRLLGDEAVTELRSREDADGVIRLAALPGGPGGWKLGQKLLVETSNSPFWGERVLFDGMAAPDRCWVLLNMMGRKVRAQVSVGDMSAF